MYHILINMDLPHASKSLLNLYFLEEYSAKLAYTQISSRAFGLKYKMAFNSRESTGNNLLIAMTFAIP